MIDPFVEANGIRCCVCGTDAKERSGLQDPDLWDDPYCPRCDKPLTPEGLLVQEIKVNGVRILREVGKDGAVVWEHPAEETTEGRPTQDDARRFLGRILELEEGSRAQTSATVSIEQGQAKWNKKAASRRFRRWFRCDYANRPLELDDPALRELAAKILKDAPGPTSLSEEIENEQKYFGKKLSDYSVRAFIEQPLIVSRLPRATRLMLIEAQDAFRFGLFRAVFAICRAILEDVTREIVCRLPNAPNPIDDTRLDVLINCLPDCVLPLRERSWAHAIRQEGNAAVHEATREFDFQEAWAALSTTTQLVQRLLNRAERPA